MRKYLALLGFAALAIPAAGLGGGSGEGRGCGCPGSTGDVRVRGQPDHVRAGDRHGVLRQRRSSCDSSGPSAHRRTRGQEYFVTNTRDAGERARPLDGKLVPDRFWCFPFAERGLGPVNGQVNRPAPSAAAWALEVSTPGERTLARDCWRLPGGHCCQTRTQSTDTSSWSGVPAFGMFSSSQSVFQL